MGELTRSLGNVPDKAPVPRGSANKRPFRYSRVGSVVASRDFEVAVPVGIGFGAFAAYSRSVAADATPILLGLAAGLLALMAVVIAAHTLVVTLMSPEYLEVVKRAPGGVKGLSRPYIIIGWVCALGTLVSAAVAFAWPAFPQGPTFWPRLARWVAVAVPAVCFVWGLLGSAQLIGLNAFHLEQRVSLATVIRDLRQRSTTRSA
jgi:hypothetical protein